LKIGIYKTIRKIFQRLYGIILSLPFVIPFLTDAEIGRPYDFGFRRKLNLILRFSRNLKKVPTESSWLEHIELASSVLQIPPSVSGDVIEFGCYKGGSSVNLSILCAATGRKLIVCDSFEGLPEPNEEDKVHYNLYRDHYDHYEAGRFAASLDEVKDNISQFGCIDVCEFSVGYFEDSLRSLHKKYVLAFFDADYVESLKPCVRKVWPNLRDRCRIYVHEATSLSLVSLFFDKKWWRDNLNSPAPGFVGSGTGLPLEPVSGSFLGYAQKGSELN
jgi:O-methyltransferase